MTTCAILYRPSGSRKEPKPSFPATQTCRALYQVLVKIDIRTEPPGAMIYMKEYSDPDSEWSYLGVSPIEKIRLPVGIFRWKIEREGYETVLAASFTWKPGRIRKWVPRSFPTISSERWISKEAFRRSGADPSGGNGYRETGDFYIDRFEVTNRQFKEFIDNDGTKGRNAGNISSSRTEGTDMGRSGREFVD